MKIYNITNELGPFLHIPFNHWNVMLLFGLKNQP